LSLPALTVFSRQDRLWCDPGPGKDCDAEKDRPVLRAIVLDCSAVNNIDITSIQGLIDLRNTFDRHAAPEVVDWHFANVYNRWARRALAVAGFGFPSNDSPEWLGRWKPAYTLAMLTGPSDKRDGEKRMRNSRAAGGVVGHTKDESDMSLNRPKTPEEQPVATTSDGVPYARLGTVHGVDRPFFHVDLGEAVDVAERNAREKDRFMGE
jgi:sodium-independent sulfate anion transporter 11